MPDNAGLMDTETKRCPRCERDLPHDCFSRDARTKSGLRCYCRECTAAKRKEQHWSEGMTNEQLEARRVRARQWKEANPDRHAANTISYLRRHPDRAAAGQAVRKAIREGRLARQPCEVCGTETDVHAHHEDYSRPFEIRWLCRAHHAAADVARRQPAAAMHENSDYGNL